VIGVDARVGEHDRARFDVYATSVICRVGVDDAREERDASIARDKNTAAVVHMWRPSSDIEPAQQHGARGDTQYGRLILAINDGHPGGSCANGNGFVDQHGAGLDVGSILEEELVARIGLIYRTLQRPIPRIDDDCGRGLDM